MYIVMGRLTQKKCPFSIQCIECIEIHMGDVHIFVESMAFRLSFERSKHYVIFMYGLERWIEHLGTLIGRAGYTVCLVSWTIDVYLQAMEAAPYCDTSVLRSSQAISSYLERTSLLEHLQMT